MSKCDVCGKETNTTVCSSTCGAISFAYCDECLRNGIEPYDALVGMGLYYDDINNTYKQQILDPSLRFYNKTKEQFNADVMAQDDDLRAFFEEYEKRKENEKDDGNEELPF